MIQHIITSYGYKNDPPDARQLHKNLRRQRNRYWALTRRLNTPQQ